MRLFFLLLFLSLNSYSQRISIADPSALVISSLDTTNNRILLFYENHYDAIDLNSFKINTYKLYKEDLWFASKNKPSINSHICIDNENYLIHDAGGIVYKLHNDTIKRIDKSYNHKMQHGVVLFENDSKIFKYGGYGFWSVRDFFTYFDTHTKEWEVYRPINSEKIPTGTYGGYHIKIDNNIYLFDGLKINPYDRWEKSTNDELWVFNFTSNKWKYLGIHSEVENNVHTSYKNKLLFLAEKHIIVIDVLKNRINRFEHNSTTAKSNNVKSIFYFNNKFYLIINDRKNSFLDTIDEKDFFCEKISDEKFYKNSKYWWSRSLIYSLIFIFILSTIWYVNKIKKKRNKIILLENGLRYKNKFVEFDHESIEILKILMAEKEVSSSKILSVVEKDQYSPAHNERIKVQKINDLNLKIKTLLGENEDIIRSFKSATDRRIRIYQVSQEHFNKI